MKPLTPRRAARIAWRARWRLVATILLPVYFVATVSPSAWAVTPALDFPAPVNTPKHVKVNKTIPKGTPYSGVLLPDSSSDVQITNSHSFAEPLLPLLDKTTVSENKALTAAIKTFLKRKDDEDTSSLKGFLETFPNSSWRPSLDMNLAEVYFRTANFSKALNAWQDAWTTTRDLKDPAGQQLANFAVGKLAEMLARIGRTDELEALLSQTKGRSISGPAAQLLVQARTGLWLMRTKPQDAFRCGPSALQELSLATKHKVENPASIRQSKSTAQGIPLSDVQKLASAINMPMQMAKREVNAPFIVPAVVHWKLGHYAALVGTQNGKYLIHDTTFGGAQFLVSPSALEAETSGYFLVPATTPLPSGWSPVNSTEGVKVLGRGNPGLDDEYAFLAIDADSGGDCGKGWLLPDCCYPGSGAWPQDAPDNSMLDPNADHMGDPLPDPEANNSGDSSSSGIEAMTVPFVKSMLVSLTLMDTPVRYSPPIGPAMHFTVHYNQREIAQPATFTYSSLGPNWTFSYMSHLTPNGSYANVYERGGGEELYYYNFSTNSYSPSQKSKSVLTQINSTTWQRSFPTGETETYGQPDGIGNFFLSKITDPYGNSLSLSYDANFRLTSLVDALGQVTTMSYVSNTVGNSAFYNISRVTDPFGRYASFAYDASGRLQTITDIIGITSQFTYSGSGTFINSLTTPYGVSSFAFGDNSTDIGLGSTRWLNITYPDGNTTRTEYNETVPLADSDPTGIPSGMYNGGGTNAYMEFRNTYYWDKQAMKMYPGNYNQAQVTHWLHTSDINRCSGIEESVKEVNENRIWFAYAGEISSIQATDTMIASPTQRGRILDDGSTQLYQYQYNALGNPIQVLDPMGRETDYTYASNNIDVLAMTQKNGLNNDLLMSCTYNSQHEPLNTVDASGQVTIHTYYVNGKLHTVTNPKGQTTTFNYTGAYLTSIIGPASGAVTSFTYDGYGRVQTVTDSQGYTITTNYDAMDRPTSITYPDGTSKQVIYHNLDIQYTRDRLGRVTRYFYNSLREPTEVVDSGGNIVHSYWTLSAGLGSMVDGGGHKTSWLYDGHNRLVEKDLPDGTNQQTAYELTTSRIKSVTDAKGQIATNSYNSDNTISHTTYTNSGIATPTVSYTYDPIYPRISTMSDGTGTTTYNYNAVTGSLGSNLLGSLATPLTVVTYAYDELRRPLSQTSGGAISSVTYDALGRIATATNALSSSPFLYSYLGNTSRVASVTNPNGQSTIYTYLDSTTTPNEPRLSEIKNLNTASAIISKFDYTYDAQGQVSTVTQQTDTNHPQKWTNQYDKEGQLSSINATDTVTGGILHQYAYLYDSAGNRTSEQIDGNVTGAAYNALNELTGQSAGGKMLFSGSTGTIPSLVTVDGHSATSSYNTNFAGLADVVTGTNNVPIIAHDVNGNTSTNTYQVVIAPSAASFTYDLNGNLTQDATSNYQWDAKNELTAIIYNSGPNAGNHTEFTYNGVGERVKIVERGGTVPGTGAVSSTKQYSCNQEFDGSNTLTKRFFGQGEQRVNSGIATSYYYTRDYLGSVREMVDSSGTIQVRYSYDPFGRPTRVSGSLTCDYQFAGMYAHLPSGQNLTAFRIYNPNTGRWLSRDPSGGASSLNLYCYSNNNPITLHDPTGLCAEDGGLGMGLLSNAGAAIGDGLSNGAEEALSLINELNDITPGADLDRAEIAAIALDALNSLLRSGTTNAEAQKILNDLAAALAKAGIPFTPPDLDPNSPLNQQIVVVVNKVIPLITPPLPNNPIDPIDPLNPLDPWPIIHKIIFPDSDPNKP